MNFWCTCPIGGGGDEGGGQRGGICVNLSDVNPTTQKVSTNADDINRTWKTFHRKKMTQFI